MSIHAPLQESVGESCGFVQAARVYLACSEGGVERVDGNDVLQEGNGAAVAAARHKLDADVYRHVRGVR